MTDILTASADILAAAGYLTTRVPMETREALVFEDATTIGFLFAYVDATDLTKTWQRDTTAAVARHNLALRRAGQKAWNAYVVLLAGGQVDHSSTVALATIEEDLSGTRKIARAGIADIEDVRAALLTLLPLQNAPRLESVDIAAEIRQRATELHPRGVDAFLSSADESIVLQVLEEAS